MLARSSRVPSSGLRACLAEFTGVALALPALAPAALAWLRRAGSRCRRSPSSSAALPLWLRVLLVRLLGLPSGPLLGSGLPRSARLRFFALAPLARF